MEVAERLGAGLGRMGVTVICGGRQGVMEATCKGVAAAGGLSIGLLPEPDWSEANPFVTVPIALVIGSLGESWTNTLLPSGFTTRW